MVVLEPTYAGIKNKSLQRLRREGLSVPLSGPLQVPLTVGDRSKRVFQPSKVGVPPGARIWDQGPCLSLAYLTLLLTFATLLPVIHGDSFLLLFKSHLQEGAEASWGPQQPNPVCGTKPGLKGA